MNKVNIAVLVSGGGTNLQALIDSDVIKSGTIQLVISNNEDAYALERAKKNKIDTYVVTKKSHPSDFEQAMIGILNKNKIDLIVMAGFLTIVNDDFIHAFKDRIINVHPSLIPSFCGEGYYGIKVHEAALEKGVKVTGVTTHFVNEIPDGGKIIMQKAVAVKDGDTPLSLQKRVMQEAEHEILPLSVEKICKQIIMENKLQTKKAESIQTLLKCNPYPGRGIIIGKNRKNQICTAYFLTGRSQNSQNRILEEVDGDIFTRAFDESKLEDPSLIIYPAIRTYQNNIIVTNGDHTDTIYEGLKNNISFEKSLCSRKFEPDSPNFTPRISGLVNIKDGDFTYKMSILKSADAQGTACDRFFYNYESACGMGHFIHTYMDGNPQLSFEGEPVKIEIQDDIDEFAGEIWESLNAQTKISLFIRYVDIKSGKTISKIINKNV